MNKTLTKIADDMSAVIELIQQEDGELNPILEGWLDEIGSTLEEKVDSYVGRIGGLELMADQCRKRAQEATKAARSLESIQERLEERIKYTMNSMGRTELSGSEWRYKLTPTKGSLVVFEDQVPESYKIQVTTWSVDKERVRAALDSGLGVMGAVIKPGFQLRKYRSTK